MIDNLKRNTVVILDNVDIDNPLAARAACHSALRLNTKAVIVTGRPAHPDRTAPIDACDRVFSQAVRRLNTQRMKGLLQRMGCNVPVFEGLIPPKTLVPHRVHIDERLLRHKGDRTVRSDGSFARAIDYLRGLKGPIDLIIGGPLGEAAWIMEESGLKSRLGTLTCQLGLFGFGNVATMAGGGLTFNSAADPDATRAVLDRWPERAFLVPTDVTKSEAVGFDTPADLRAFGVAEEFVRLYGIFWKVALQPRGERIYPHDVHPVFLMAQLRKVLTRSLYTWQNVQVKSVGARGEISAVFGPTATNSSERFVIKTVEASRFKKLLRTTAR